MGLHQATRQAGRMFGRCKHASERNDDDNLGTPQWEGCSQARPKYRDLAADLALQQTPTVIPQNRAFDRVKTALENGENH
jgi:hypothetical protein